MVFEHWELREQFALSEHSSMSWQVFPSPLNPESQTQSYPPSARSIQAELG